jgi:hypothetical protein
LNEHPAKAGAHELCDRGLAKAPIAFLHFPCSWITAFAGLTMAANYWEIAPTGGGVRAALYLHDRWKTADFRQKIHLARLLLTL